MKTKIMKVLGQLLFFLMVLSIIFVSCNKSTLTKDNNPTNNNDNLKSSDLTTLQYVWLGDHAEWLCFFPPSNCLPEVVIHERLRKNSNGTLTDYKVYKEFLSAISNGTTDSFFSASDYLRIFPYLSETRLSQYLDILQSDTVRFIDGGLNPSDSA